jgi:hypothetical protein
MDTDETDKKQALIKINADDGNDFAAPLPADETSFV